MKGNKINIVSIILGILIGSVVTFLIMFFTQKCDVCEKCLSKDELCNNSSNVEEDEHVLSEEEKQKYSDLGKIGKELYNNGKYLTFNREDNGLYYVNFNSLKQMGYDVSEYKECDQEMAIIYFDPDNILNIDYAEEPIQINLNCGIKNKK